jgi:hypothetical protein
MDYFALFNQPRRPWLDAEALRQKFLALSAEVHPDRVHGADEDEKKAAHHRYTELNSAYNCLREPKERLQHLLELESGVKPAQVQTVPAGLMELFLEVGGLCRQADAFLTEKGRVASPLLQVEMFEKSQDWIEKLKGLAERISVRRAQLEADLKAIDQEWASERGSAAPNHDTALKRLEELWRLFSYFARWSAQIQERIVQLSF